MKSMCSALAVCLAAATAVAGDGDIRVDAGETRALSSAPAGSITKTGFGTLETDFDFTGKFALAEGTWRLKGGSTVVCDGSHVNETSWFYVKGAKDSMLAPAEGAYIEVTDGSSLTVKGVNYVGLGDRYIGGSNRTRGYGSIVVTGGSFLDLAPNSQVRLTDFGSVGGTAILAISNSTAVIRKPIYVPPTEHADNSAKFIVSGSSVSAVDIAAQGAVEKNGSWFDAATLTPLAASTNWLSSGAKTPASYYRILAGGLTVDAACDVTIPESGILSGPGGLVKTGARTLTLAAANTYEGTTTVCEGTLEVTGSLAGPLELAGGTLALGGGATIPCLTVSAKGSLTLNGDGVTVGAASGYDGRLQVTATNLGRYGIGTVLVRSGDAAFLDWLRRNLLTRIAADLDLAVADGALTLVGNPAGEAAVGGVVGRVSFTDGLECWQNPGCGYAGGGWSTLEKDKYVDVKLRSPNQTKLWSLQKFSKGYLYNNNPTHYEKAMHYCGGADIPLNAYALESVSNAFESCRAAGGTVIPRFAYTWDGFGGCEPDDFEMILTHIRQLAALCSQYRDVIPAVECGTIGAYGEMHTSRYCDREHARRITFAWLDGLPDDMAFLVRSPCYVIYESGAENTTEFLLSGVADSPRIRRVGFYNDGYLGTDGDYGTWGAGGTSFTRAQGRAYLRSRGNVPYGGEFATVTDDFFDQNVHLLDVSKFNLVEEWYDTHLSYLRTIRSPNMTVWQRLDREAFDSAKWAFDNMPYLAEYDGQTLQKFCEDHMGYRFVVRALEARRTGREVKLSLSVENTGFGRLCFPETKEIVLSDAAGGLVTLPATGTDLRLLEGGRTTAVEIGFTLPEGIPLGRYYVALRERVPLSNEDGTGLPRRAIAFANEGSYDAATKANYLGIIRIDGTTDAVTAEDHSSGGTVMVAPDKVADLRNVTFTEGARLVVAGGGRVVLGRSVPALIEIENGRLEFSSWPADFDPGSVIAHGNAVTLRNDDAEPVRIDLSDRTYDGFALEGNCRYVVPSNVTVTIDAQRWIADFGIDVYGKLDVRADLVLAGSVDVTIHAGGTMGNLGRDATSSPGRMIVRDRARIVVRKGGHLLNPVNGNWSGSGLELMTQAEGTTSLVLDGGTVAVHRMSGTGLGRIEVRSDSEWDVWYGAWYGEHRPPSPFKGASEVFLADGATLAMTRIRQDFGSNQQDGGDITVRLADVHVTGSGDLRFANAHPTKKVAFEIVAANDCTGEVSLEEGTGATLTFLSGSSWGGDIVMTPGVVIPEDWWFSANAATGACYGGAWQGRDGFDVAEPAGAAYDAVMSFSGVAGWMGELPERHGIVSFLFLEEAGALRPYGWTAEGWIALSGKEFAEGVTFELEVDFRFRKGAWTVGFTADGAALADERGRVRFPVDYDPGALRRIVFDGPGKHGDFRGRLLCRRVPGFKVIVR